jgi:TRAP-type C4-dicarboxylate transport system permease small subunit
MEKLITILAGIDRVLTAVLKYLTIALFLVLTFIVTANVLLRYIPITSLHWMDEIVEMCFAALVFYGAAGVWMVKGHFSVGDWIGKRVKNDRVRNGYRLLLELIVLMFAAIFFKYSLELGIRAQEATSVFQIPKKVLYSCMPVSALIMMAYSIVYVVRGVVGIVNPKALASVETSIAAARRP